MEFTRRSLMRWLSPDDTHAIRWFFEGLPQGQVIPWESWVRPLVTWISFILVFYWTLLCLGVILRGQREEGERLVFPAVLAAATAAHIAT